MMVTAIIFGILVVYGAVLVLFWRYIETLEEQIQIRYNEAAKWKKDALDLSKDMYQTMEKWVEEETIMIAKLNGIKEKEAGNE